MKKQFNHDLKCLQRHFLMFLAAPGYCATWYSVLLLFSPYLCFISLLYLDLYVLGDDALIS